MRAGALVLLAALVLSVVPQGGAAEEPGRELLWRLVSPLPGAGVVEAALGDLDGDGLPDLLLWSAGRGGPWTIAAVDGSGSVLWSRPSEERPYAAVSRGDGGLPVVFVAAGESLEMLSGSGGDVLVHRGIPGLAGAMAVGDLDGDGRPDVAVSSGTKRNDHLTACSGVDLCTLFAASAAPDESRLGDGFGRPLLSDADGDGLCEIYVAENTDRLTKLTSDGRRAWSVVLDERAGRLPKGAVTGGPIVADVTGDGRDEVVVGCLAGGLFALDAETGERMVAGRFGVRTGEAALVERRLPRFLRKLVAGCGEPLNDPTAVELDGRPGLDLVFGCSDGALRAYSPAAGTELWSIKCGGKVYDAPLTLDWNEDGRVDAVAWHEDAALLVDGRTGKPMIGLPPIADPGSLMLGDLDGDGVDELVVVRRGARTVEAWHR